MFDLPDPVGMVEAAINGKLEREVVNSAVSAAYSSYINGLWRAGFSKWMQVIGLGQAIQDMATSTYLAIRGLEANGFLRLSLPQDFLKQDFSRFQTEYKAK